MFRSKNRKVKKERLEVVHENNQINQINENNEEKQKMTCLNLSDFLQKNNEIVAKMEKNITQTESRSKIWEAQLQTCFTGEYGVIPGDSFMCR